MKELIFFPKYTAVGPSSRYRIYNYLPYFEDEYKVTVHPFFDDSYSPYLNFKSLKGLLYVLKSYVNRAKALWSSRNKTVVIQYDLFPYLPYNALVFKLLRIQYILDYDDAVFHQYDKHSNRFLRAVLKNKIPNLMQNASRVITGSEYLTNFAKQYTTKVTEIPTSITIDKYVITNKEEEERFVIGWIGSKSTSVNILTLLPVFEKLKEEGMSFTLKFVGFDTSLNAKFNHLPFENIPWSETTEISSINSFDVGIMPLEDVPFNHGKCAFKLIQYMACAKPTIATPLQSNVNVDRNKENLFATTTAQWIMAIKEVYNNKSMYKNVGDRNRKIIEEFYTTKANSNSYKTIFKKV